MVAMSVEGFDARDGLRIGEEMQTALGVVEHVPGVAAAGLDRFHVVLDRDDRVREPIDGLLRQRESIAPDKLSERAVDAFHDLRDASLAEHQQTRGNAAHELWNLVDRLRLARLLEPTAQSLP